MLPHNPPAPSWGDQNQAVKLDVKRSNCYTGVAQRKRAVKTPSSTFLPLVVRFEDGYRIYTTEDVGSKPTTGIFFTSGLDLVKTI